MEKRLPSLEPDELRQLRWLLGGLLTLVAAWSAFYLDVSAGPALAVTTLGAVLATVRPDWPARVPRWVHRLVFPGIVAVFAGDLWLSGEILPAMVRLDLLLLAYRAITYRRRRDDLQVVVLGLFLVVVAGVLTVSIAFAVQILAFTACALAFMLTITLTEEGPSPRKPPRLDPTETPAWARQVRWRRLLRRLRETTDVRVLLLGAGLFLGLVVLSSLLFLAIPRFQLENSLWLDRFITKKAKTGFSDTIRFGDVTDIQQDDSVALSVDVSDRTRIPADPYWRMLVLDEYRDGTFRLSPELRRATFSRERTGAGLRGGGRAREATPVVWTFYLESGVSRYLPLLGAFETLQFREAQNFRWAEEPGLVALRDEPVSMTAYRVEGMVTGALRRDPDFSRRLRSTREADAAMARRATELPFAADDRTKLAAAVREITGGAELPPGEFDRRATAWLRARHGYSLQPVVPAGAGDPLVRWLTAREGGHCELFAGALALLAREAGFPARVATGFHGGSWNGYSNNFTIRNSDAHAWCEVFDAAAGAWVRADPTPGSTEPSAAEQPGETALARRLDRSWTARLDSLRVFWYRRIVNFDQRSQLETFKAVKAATEESGKRLREALERFGESLRAWLSGPWSGMKIARLFAVILAAGCGVIASRRGGAWLRAALQRRRGIDPVRREAGRELAQWRKMTEAGAKPPARALLGELERLRFGRRETWGDATETFRRSRRTRRRGSST